MAPQDKWTAHLDPGMDLVDAATRINTVITGGTSISQIKPRSLQCIVPMPVDYINRVARPKIEKAQMWIDNLVQWNDKTSAFDVRFTNNNMPTSVSINLVERALNLSEDALAKTQIMPVGVQCNVQFYCPPNLITEDVQYRLAELGIYLAINAAPPASDSPEKLVGIEPLKDDVFVI